MLKRLLEKVEAWIGIFLLLCFLQKELSLIISVRIKRPIREKNLPALYTPFFIIQSYFIRTGRTNAFTYQYNYLRTG